MGGKDGESTEVRLARSVGDIPRSRDAEDELIEGPYRAFILWWGDLRFSRTSRSALIVGGIRICVPAHGNIIA